MNNRILQDIINEEISDYLIDETYKSVNEIKKLANDVIKSIAENNIDQIENRGQIDYLFGTYLNAVDADQYDELKNFIKDANIAISIDQKELKSTTRGMYTTSSTKIPYKPEHPNDIVVYIDDLPELFSKINNSVKEEKHFDADRLYVHLFYELYSTLVHELQHAYDDYRSKGKLYQTKQYKKYLEKYVRGNIENEINSDIEQAKKYVNLPHEIWARFSQAMINTRFTTLDIKDNKVILEMKPIKKVVSEFKRYFDHYRELSDVMKRKLINKVVQFWHYEQDNLDDRIKELNKKRK
jgi:hypothetical protein